MTKPVTPWVVVGCGRVGTAMTIMAGRLGIRVVAAWDRSGPPNVNAEQCLTGSLQTLENHTPGAAVLLAVSDDAITAVAKSMAGFLDNAAVVVHFSGSRPSTTLRDAGVGAPVGSVHPLLAIADPVEAVERFSTAAWTIEGDSAALWWARGWLALLDVKPATIDPERKALYHASAVTSAGLVVGLMDVAFELATASGLSQDQARQMLLPLVRSTLDNLEQMSTENALTGPIARGDEAVVERHLEAIEALEHPSTAAIYRLLTQRCRELGD